MEKGSIKWDTNNDRELLLNFVKYGTKWHIICKLFSGATENMVKNRFYCLLRSTAVQENKKTKTLLNKNNLEMDIIDKFFETSEVAEINMTDYNNFNIDNQDINDNNDYKLSKEFNIMPIHNQTSNNTSYIENLQKSKNEKLGNIIKYLPDLLRKYNITSCNIKFSNDNKIISTNDSNYNNSLNTSTAINSHSSLNTKLISDKYTTIEKEHTHFDNPFSKQNTIGDDEEHNFNLDNTMSFVSYKQ